MLDKRLYREVSDLLELQVDDDRLVRILLVQGFTTEQIKRAIKDIRAKGDLPESTKKAGPVSETIEAGASKRFNMLDKVFGTKSEAEIIAEETKKMEDHEKKLQEEEQKLVQEAVELTTNSKQSIPADIKKVLKLMDSLLGKLPEAEVKRFAKSQEFDTYQAVMKKYL